MAATQERVNPHGHEQPCNLHCQRELHVCLILGCRWCNDGSPADAASLIAGCTPYFQSLGWQVIAARRAETETALVWAQMADHIQVQAFETTEERVKNDMSEYDHWLITVMPYTPEDATA